MDAYGQGRRKRHGRRRTAAFIIKPLIVLAILILMVVIAKALKYHSPLGVSYVENNVITSENMYKAEKKQAGSAKKLSEDEKHLYYSANYPHIGNEAIDYVLENDAQNIIDSFKDEYLPEKPKKKYRAYMNMDYESYYAGNRVLSVAYYISYYATGDKRPSQKLHTHVFSLADGGRLTFDDIFKDGAVEFLSGKIGEHLKENYDIKDYKPDVASLDFTLSDSGIALFLEAGTAASEEYGCISIPVSKSEIEPYLAFDPYSMETPAPLPSETQSPVPSGTPAKLVAFTFDDGPSQSATEKILDVLEKYNCHATFFVVGNRVRGRESTVKRAFSLGCEIGSHSFDHAPFSDKTSKEIKREFSRSNDILMDVIGVKAPVVRTPYGSHTPKVLKAVNFPVILWNVDTQDWKTRNDIKNDKKAAKKTAKKIINGVSDGDIVLMHDLYDETAKAVEIAVPKLIKKGYRVVSVSELMQYKGIKLKPHKAYYSAE